MRAAPLNPLLGALPPALKGPAVGAEASPALAGAAAMLAAECGRRSRNGFTAQRLLEVFCAEAIRSFQQSQRARDAGWFRGLADPKISEAVRTCTRSRRRLERGRAGGAGCVVSLPPRGSFPRDHGGKRYGLWSGPLGPGRGHAADLTACRVC
jgi:hypothetical protein